METNKINYITIQQYLDGSLDKEAMHELEKQALEDPFLADALEGYTHSNKPAARQLSLLQTQLEERIAQQQENKNVFNFSWQRLSVAAAASLLFITASILFWIKGEKRDEQVASNLKQVHVSLTPVDSIDSAASQLAANKKLLSETMVVGNETSKEVNEYPEPAIGWSKYKEYLQKKSSDLKLNSGTVVVVFTVGPDNKLSNFRIEKGQDTNQNREAIRLIKEGPVWNIGQQPEVRVTVSFKE